LFSLFTNLTNLFFSYLVGVTENVVIFLSPKTAEEYRLPLMALQCLPSGRRVLGGQTEGGGVQENFQGGEKEQVSVDLNFNSS
jgi:hypothetical protein